MVCNSCGREIPDHAQFCDYCGAQVQNSTTTEPRKVVLRKNKKTRAFWSTVLSIVVFVVIKTLITEACTPKVVTDTSLTGACTYGALYEDGYLSYGATQLYMPEYDFTLDDDESNDTLLYSLDNGYIFMVGNVKQSEAFSYNRTRGDDLLDDAGNFLSNASQVSFKKYTVDGYPVIRFIARGTVDGEEMYAGELIVLPGKVAKESIQFLIITGADGEAYINKVFDTLEISPAFAPTYADTLSFGSSHITMK